MNPGIVDTSEGCMMVDPLVLLDPESGNADTSSLVVVMSFEDLTRRSWRQSTGNPHPQCAY
jgi:hypothetical protein